MKVDKQDLLAAVTAGVLDQQQADRLWQFWQNRAEAVPTFCFSHLLYYFGGMISITAVTIFITNAWDLWVGMPLLFLSMVLFLGGLWLTQFFINKNLRIPAGVVATFSLAVVPLGVFNIQYMLGYAPHDYHYVQYHQLIDWYWIPMEMATLLIGAIMLYVYRLPFLVFIVAMSLWYLSMDLWPLISYARVYDFQDRAVFSMCFGFLMIATTIYADFKWESRQDYLFWLYIVSVIVFWGGLSCQNSTTEFGRFIYFLINLSMVLASALLNRRVFAIFGAFGVFGYLGHLSYSVFADSLGFPFALILIGLLIIFSGIKWPAFSIWFIQKLTPYLPEVLIKRLRN